MRLVGLDTETTGSEPEQGHRIIELTLLAGDLTFKQRGTDFFEVSWQHVCTKTWRFNPMRTIEPAAIAVHGIELADLKDEPVFKQHAEYIAEQLAESNLIIAHNAEFDISFLVTEFLRCGVDMPERPVFCTMENGRNATAMGKLPTLGELCFAHDVPYDPSAAHSSEYDTECLMKAFLSGLSKGWFPVIGELLLNGKA